MRQLIITAIINTYLQSRDYGDYIRGNRKAHERICEGLHRMTDEMLLAVYQRLLIDNPVIPVLVQPSGKAAELYLPRIQYHGFMCSDGSIHT